MRLWLALTLCLGFCTIQSQAIDLGADHAILVNSNLISSATANTTNTVDASLCKLHTFELTMASVGNTNLYTIYLDRTLDGVNWVSWYTNSAIGSTNGDLLLSGTWQQFRARLVVTNANDTVTLTYQGLR